MRRSLRFRSSVDIRRTLAPLRHGADDPTIRLLPGAAWRATRTPEGPATLSLEVTAEACGPGAEWALEHAPALLGSGDDRSGFRPAHPVVRRLHERAPGLRIPRSNQVVEALVPAVLAQRVTAFEASRSFRQLVVRWGEPAPGPGGLVLPPLPDLVATIPYYELHVIGIEKKRADTLRRVAGMAPRLETLAGEPLEDANRRLLAITGVGAWTVAEVALVAFGDADAVSVGDYQLKHEVAWALAREEQGTDDRMLQLLEPFAGHRGRVCRLIVTSRIRRPRHAPRQRIQPLASR
jgi:3-methyladenine DNA glycosylase/8-oxoguanine DNA glycosylase